MSDSRPIGIFDSGVGGLTVYRALRARLPDEAFVYLGDTARLPYGTKSPDTVARYAVQVARRLLDEDIKMLVVACNTASALALSELRALVPHLPIQGVIEPGAHAAVRASRSGRVVVWATEGTIRSGAYQEAIRRHSPETLIQGVACNLLVGLAEEGWTDGAVAEAVIGRYLGHISLEGFDTLVLGCTHFPLLAGTVKRLLPPGVELVDSAETTAAVVAAFLADRGLLGPQDGGGGERFWVTDGPERFRQMAHRFLGGRAVGSVDVTDV